MDLDENKYSFQFFYFYLSYLGGYEGVWSDADPNEYLNLVDLNMFFFLMMILAFHIYFRYKLL